MAFCPRCGWRLMDGATSCEDCGLDLLAWRRERGDLLASPKVQAAGAMIESTLKAAVLVAAMITALALLLNASDLRRTFPEAAPALAAGDDWESPRGGLGMRQLIPLRNPSMLAGNWELVVLEAGPDAPDQRRQAALRTKFTEPVIAYRALVKLTYRGIGFGRFRASDRLRSVGVSGFMYTTLDAHCAMRTDPLSSREFAPGESLEGELCWAVRPVDAESLVMFDQHAFFDPKVGHNFALR